MVLLLLSACGHSEPQKITLNEERTEEQRTLEIFFLTFLQGHDDGERVEMARFTPFAWDTVHLFGGYTQGETINQALGVEWVEPDVMVPEHQELLIFSHRGRVVEHLLTSASIFNQIDPPLSPETAIFEVQVEPDDPTDRTFIMAQ